jgi:hypothetical protein
MESTNPRGSKLLATFDDLAIAPQQEISHSMFPMLKDESAEGIRGD